MSKLTEKQKRFADYYIESGNATEAYRQAYNSTDKTASVEGFKNLAKPSVKKYIEERMKKIEKECIASQDEVLSYLTSIMRGEQTEQTLQGVGKGAQVIADIEVSAKDRIKAAELIGKRYALWTDKHQHEGDMFVTFVDDLSDEDEA